MTQQPYQRNPDGARLQFAGMNTVLPPDKLPPNKYPFAQNVRAYLRDRVTGRATLGLPVQTLPFSVHSIRRLNDTTPAGPAAGFILVEGASIFLYANSVQVDTGFSGNPLSLVPFRPNASVQPWMYVGDSLKMDKVRSDGLTYKMGIAEPQTAPSITSKPASGVVSLVGPVTVMYWGDSPHSGPVGVYIWKNASDTSGSGPVRNAIAATGTTTGNSLVWDKSPGNQTLPMQWTQYTTYSGAVDTNGTAVTWDSGDQFGNLASGDPIVINGVTYEIATAGSTSITLTASAGIQTEVAYTSTTISGSVPLFQPALESEGYADFNFVALATIFIPVAGTYTFFFNALNDAMWGIGNSSTGTAQWPGPTAGQNISSENQKKTVWNGYPLIPRVYTNSGAGAFVASTIQVTFSAPGNYPLEIDYDYWHHSGRTCTLLVSPPGGGSGPQNIPPLPQSVITEAQYRYVYRSSATGALSNPSPESPSSLLSVLVNTIQATPSPDPQVDKIDYYRLDSGLANFTYVGTGPNVYPGPPPPFSDALLDADVAANPILEFDNFEPFPSIDLPRGGVVNVVNGVANWFSGDQFNVRWLPGTIIIVGTIAYTLDKRPISATQLTATNTEIVSGVSTVVPLQDGTNLPYEIAEPDLAAQPIPYLWGPTDNVSFFFGVGDPLRPGTLYWSKGNNPDSAPDTNQQDVTSPSEPLMNGVIVNGIGFVMSSERGFLVYPNFFNALATVTGTEGATWTIQESISTRGLYMPKAIAADGGGNVFFRAKDGIYVAPGGQGSESITDGDLYNLFPHEGFKPSPITRGGFTVYPPDDTKIHAQKLNCANGYLYYDYQDASATKRTLVYDIAAKGWIVDVYGIPVGVHILEEGANVNGVLAGCQDGTVRPFINDIGDLPGTPPVSSSVTVPASTGTWVYTNGGLNSAFKYDYNIGGTLPIVILCSPGESVVVAYVSGLAEASNSGPLVNPLGRNDAPAGGGFPFNPNRYAGQYVPPGFAAGNPCSTMCCLGVFTDASGVLVGLPFVVGLGGTFLCPAGASQLQLGVNDAFTFSDNVGSWTFNVTVNAVNQAENATSALLMPCFTAGDVRAAKKWGDLYVEAGPAGS